MSAELPADPKAARRIEKAIAKEAKADEKEYQRALKELKRTEKAQAKASEDAIKAGKHLKKMEDRQHDTIKSLQKATHKHDRALTDLHTAQGEVQIQRQRAQRLSNSVFNLRVRANGLSKAKQSREVGRQGERLDI